MRKVTLLYRCDREWSALEGRDPMMRRCNQCRLDVVDLRRFSEDEADEYLQLADVAQEEVCGVMSDAHEATSCCAHPDSAQREDGGVVMGRMTNKPDPETDRGRWEIERRNAIANADGGKKTEALARIEQRAAVARTKMAELVQRAKART
jgi:hypothetical protein